MGSLSAFSDWDSTAHCGDQREEAFPQKHSDCLEVFDFDRGYLTKGKAIDVAVAKARNMAYYANTAQLQPIDQVQGLPPGVAMTNRTFRYLGEPRFPEGIDPAPPGPFSQLNDDPTGTNRFTGLQVGAPLPASAYQSVVGYDSFNPQTNFHNPFNILNQNGIVFFPGSSALYMNRVLLGGFGVSGDGVDQDDVATVTGQTGFEAPNPIRADLGHQGLQIEWLRGQGDKRHRLSIPTRSGSSARAPSQSLGCGEWPRPRTAARAESPD